jgi:hypothetical protein
MSTLNVGDRVHLKWDHSVTGTVIEAFSVQRGMNRNDHKIVLELCSDRGTVYKTHTPASWWERIPEPLKELVPIEVLEEAFDDLQEGGTIVVHVRTRLARWLRERGYGKAEG